METRLLLDLKQLTDNALLAQVKHLARSERETTVRLVAHLAELDARKLYLGEGCASLFSYCVEALHFSEYAAYGRIQAARAARKFPVVLERLASGSLNLTTLGLLAPHLTAENHAELLTAADHKSKRQVELLVAALRPQPDVAAMVRRLPEARVVPLAATPAATPGSLDESGPEVPAPARLERYKIQFTASAATHAKLRLAQELLRHQIPNGDPAAIIDRALSLLVAELEKRKFAKLSEKRMRRQERMARPVAGRATVSRHIPAEVRREVWARDGARCAFMTPDGRRCGEGGLLEFHHVDPHGPGTLENIELRCGAHNRYEADLYYGPGTSGIRRGGTNGDGLVREGAATYMTAGHAAAGVATGSGPSWRSRRARRGSVPRLQNQRRRLNSRSMPRAITSMTSMIAG